MEIAPKWYHKGSESDAANLISSEVRRILGDLSGRREDDRLYLDIMSNCDPVGNDGTMQGEQLLAAPAVDGRVRFNLIRAFVNTLRSHLGATDLSVKCVTNGAEWSQIKRAHYFELFIDSIAEDNKLHELVKEVFTDAATVPVGAVKLIGDDGRIKIERVHPEEILVDTDEGYYGTPRNLYQIKNMSKEDLVELFPDAEEVIDRSDKGSINEAFSWLPGWSLGADRVQVVEAWHLPYRKNGKYLGGRHMIVTTAGILLDEDYPIPTFPIIVYRWEKRPFGFYGMSVAEDLRLAHETVRYFDIRVQDALYNISRIKIIAEDTAKVETFDDDPANVYLYPAGNKPPQVFAPSVIPIELLQFRTATIMEARDQVGINEMMQKGEKPSGVTAAIAMRELQDMYSQRFKDKIEEIESFYLDVARGIIRLAVWMDTRGELQPVRSKITKGRRTEALNIKFKDINMDDEEYWLQMSKSSSLPKSTAARKQTVQDWLDSGLIDLNEARELMGFPDLDRFTEMKLSAYHEALDKIEEIVEEGKYTPPEVVDDLALQHKLGIQSYQLYRRLGVPHERLDLLLQLANESLDLLTSATASMAQQQLQPALAAAPPVGQRQLVPPGMPPAQPETQNPETQNPGMTPQLPM